MTTPGTQTEKLERLDEMHRRLESVMAWQRAYFPLTLIQEQMIRGVQSEVASTLTSWVGGWSPSPSGPSAS